MCKKFDIKFSEKGRWKKFDTKFIEKKMMWKKFEIFNTKLNQLPLRSKNIEKNGRY